MIFTSIDMNDPDTEAATQVDADTRSTSRSGRRICRPVSFDVTCTIRSAYASGSPL